jgi:hypothetical protein
VMPPRVEPVPKPKTRGKDAKEYLEAHGLVARKLPVRSSDFERCLRDPFGYYLTRRLGLTDGLSYSEALTRGSWFHVAHENCLEPWDLQLVIREERLEARFEELTQMCRRNGISAEGRLRILEKEEHDARTAWAWWDIAKDLPLTGDYSTLQWYNLPFNEVLGFEIPVRLKIQGVECQLQYDALVWHKTQNKVWAVDVKTTGLQPIDRAATCQIEFQTQLYLHGLQVLLNDGVLHDTFGVDRDASLGGFRHIIVQKPTIKFGMADRDCREYEHELLRGPRKGQVEVRREYEGEPRIENYIHRIGEWYRKDGMYSHLEGEEPDRVTFSDISASLLDDLGEVKEFNQRLQMVNRYATVSPEPQNFPRSVSGCTGRGKLSALAPFYVCPIDQWPTIVDELQLVQAWRDGDIDESQDEG